MSRRRKFGIVLSVVLATVLVASAVGVGWLYVTLRPVGEFFEHGLLGPPDQRQRVEMPAHGFAISFADDWVVETSGPERLEAGRSHLQTVLAAGPVGHHLAMSWSQRVACRTKITCVPFAKLHAPPSAMEPRG